MKQAVKNEARTTMYHMTNDLGNIVRQLMNDKNELLSQGLDQTAKARVNSIDMLHLAMDLIAYADFLNDKNTLKYETFLIPKYERAQLIIENCKTRIKQAK